MGRLLYTPERLGRTRIGDLLDAMAGYNEGQYERVKEVGELIRRSTWYLWNIQVTAEDKAQTPADLWPMPWDKKESYEQGEVSEESRKELEERQTAALKNM